MTPVELAWAAGILEGEGSIRINSATKRNNGALIVDVVNTDLEIVALYQAWWPGSQRGPIVNVSNSNTRAYYLYRAASRKAARLLADVGPYLRTDRMREKAALGLAYQAQKSMKHDNRTPEYAARQLVYFHRMKELNRRGAGTEPGRAR